jgi:predicted nucleotidyltransferase
MDNHLTTSYKHVWQFVTWILKETKHIVKEDMIGFYIHGSLAMGGFNPNKSDIDLLVVTKRPLTVERKRRLVQLFLNYSTRPYPIEVSFLNENQLQNWEHPSSFDFHYSEDWRERYNNELTKRVFIQEKIKDNDLAAHITVTYHRGICVEGKPIKEVFPLVPRSHYISSIMSDFQDCLKNVEKNPIYCTLNFLRVYWYLKEGVISSKKEAGEWGLLHLPQEYHSTIGKVLDGYTNEKKEYSFEKNELLRLRNFIKEKVQQYCTTI